MNIEKLGKNQKRILKRMLYEDLVIRVTNDHGKDTIELQDEPGDNIYESISWDALNRLGKRKLFRCSGWMPALFVTVDTYTIKPKVKEVLFKKIN